MSLTFRSICNLYSISTLYIHPYLKLDTFMKILFTNLFWAVAARPYPKTRN